ncbi:hypothetical protein [Kineosporia mesophila]|uniref:hypothetical protein n=1 Tax=Kineosporia mesophila TaxID=566012 RepID=UPI001E37AB5D|nr:hypothetical protein [Kineosporia mesophila]MCD5349113.1 hypothetical protein [Kineosporia mesophila]
MNSDPVLPFSESGKAIVVTGFLDRSNPEDIVLLDLHGYLSHVLPLVKVSLFRAVVAHVYGK